MTDLLDWGDEDKEVRTLGQFPVSIATSLALEGLYGVLEDNPNPSPPCNNYDHVLINFRTLFRNIVGAFPASERDHLYPKDYMPIIIEEMRIIRNILKSQSTGKLTVQFYACSYADLSNMYPYSFFKEVKSAKQKEYAAMENTVFDMAYKSLGGITNNILSGYDTTIPSVTGRTLVITHYPIDLLNIVGAGSLALLESHTGVVKTRPEWSSKLVDHKLYPRIPFDRMTVQVFGDTGNLFRPYPHEFRKRLGELSTKYEWNGTTTKSRIIQCVQLSKDPVLLVEVTKLYFI